MIFKERTSEYINLLKQEFNKRNIEYDVPNLIPDSLFRYTIISDYLHKNLQKDVVTAVSPRMFNDIFDSDIIIGTDESIKKKFKENEDIAKKAGYKWPQSEKEFIYSMNKRIESYKSFAKDSVMITSFSENKDSSLMWGYYADSGKGICVEYSTNAEIFNYVYPVSYNTTILNLEHFIRNESTEKVELAVFLSTLNKDVEWRHEQEWRLILPNLNNHSIMPAKINTLKSITLGPRFFKGILDSNGLIKINYLNFFNVIQKKNIPIFSVHYSYNRKANRKLFDTNAFNNFLQTNKSKRISSDELHSFFR